ncbi:AMP-binding protein [Arthrobacter sp. M4]|uniref:AMP-binding protein n=1 Tax=Arthrobacter sp. M4 TaxID=218160 RepID=UPI001CDCAC07|nr:AMP-binding protein [Arthrobacter sp. M4]MCA4133582.1 AMP-binding protein [Arthrobacter sp. M4]
MREASTALLTEADPASNITDLLRERVEADPGHVLFIRQDPNGWLNVTGQQFLAEVTALAKGLIASGLGFGEPVAVVSRTSYEWSVADFAVWWAGGVTVPLDRSSSASRIEWVLADSGALRVLVDTEHTASRVRKAIDGAASLPDDPIAVVRMGFSGEAPNFASLAGVGRGVADDELERHRSHATLSELASIVYPASGEQRPRGCEITHANLALVARNAGAFLPDVLGAPGSRALLALPGAHGPARAVQLSCLAAGTTIGHSLGGNHLADELDAFKPSILVADVAAYEGILVHLSRELAGTAKEGLMSGAEATAAEYARAEEAAHHGDGTGAGWLLRARHAAYQRLAYPRVRSAFGGHLQHAIAVGAPRTPEAADLEFILNGAGIPLMQAYGQTQATAAYTVNVPGRRRAGSAGIPFPGTTVRVAEDGEVLVKGVGVFRGYHNNPAATSEAFTDGFHHTGDTGVLDADGFLTITGRKGSALPR